MKSYVSFVLLDSVKSLYSEFESGFLKLCGGEVLQLFHYQELSALVRGQKVIDFTEFEEVRMYKSSGYMPFYAYVQWDLSIKDTLGPANLSTVESRLGIVVKIAN